MLIKVSGKYEILLVKNSRAKRVIFKIDRDNLLKLIIPKHISFKNASIIANNGVDIIEKLISKNKSRQYEYCDLKPEYSISNHTIRLIEIMGIEECKLDLEKYRIEYPFGLTGYQLKNKICTDLRKMIHDIASKVLPQKLQDCASRYNIKYESVRLRCNRTRWGSCSTFGNISLDIKIALLPKHLQDYIIAHELAHIKQSNHGRAFWDHLSKLLNTDSKLLQKELQKYKHDLFFYI